MPLYADPKHFLDKQIQKRSFIDKPLDLSGTRIVPMVMNDVPVAVTVGHNVG